MVRFGVALALALAGACGTAEETGELPPVVGGSADNCTVDNAFPVTYVTLRARVFVPSCLKVPVHTTVTFRNADTILHSVTTDASAPSPFDSGPLVSGFIFQQSFDLPGVYTLHSSFQPDMRAVVIVE